MIGWKVRFAERLGELLAYLWMVCQGHDFTFINFFAGWSPLQLFCKTVKKNSTFFSTYWIYVGTVFTKPAPPLWLHCILWSEFLRCSHCQKFAPEWEKLAEKAPRYPTASMESIEKIMIKTGVSYRMRLLQSLARHSMMKYALLGSQHDQPEQWRALVAFHPVTINPAAEIKWFDYILTRMVEVKPFARAEQSDVFHLIWHDLQYVFICWCFLVPLTVNLKVHGQDGTAMKFPDRDGIERQVRLIKPGSPGCQVHWVHWKSSALHPFPILFHVEM